MIYNILITFAEELKVIARVSQKNLFNLQKQLLQAFPTKAEIIFGWALPIW